MTDIENAVACLLPEVWRPGRKCWHCADGSHTGGHSYTHDIPCPPLTRDLAMRLLESGKGTVGWNLFT